MEGQAQPGLDGAAEVLRKAMDQFVRAEALPEDELPASLERLLWETLTVFQNQPFCTAKGLAFTYYIKGNEMFVDRRDKSITRSTVALSLGRAAEIRRRGAAVTGPKKLGTFGASYIYPIFRSIGVLDEEWEHLQLEESLAMKGADHGRHI